MNRSRRRVQWLLAVVVALLSVTPGQAQSPSAERTGTAILIDVSGSMRFSEAPNWKENIEQSLVDLIEGGKIDESKWRVDGSASGDQFVTQLRQGRPLHLSGQPLLIAYIGEVTDEPPFVRYLEMTSPPTPPAAANYIRIHFPASFDDQWTYKDVAEGAVADAMLEEGATSWYVVTVSDFDDDYDDPSKVSERVQRSGSASMVGLTREKLIALSYRNAPSLRMEITRVASRDDPCDSDPERPLCDGPEEPPVAQGRVTLRSPESGAEFEPGNVPPFRWTAPVSIRRFEILIRDVANESTSRFRRQGRSFTLPDTLSEGTYEWQVIGFENEKQLTSRRREFSIAQPSSMAWLWILGGLGLVGGGGYLAYRRMVGQPWSADGPEDDDTISLD